MIKHSLSFDGNSFAFLALAGIIFKLFIGNSVSDNGVTGPASSTIWGYGLVTISLLMVLFINVAIVSRMSTLKESNIAFIKSVFFHSMPPLLLLSILAWIITINVKHFNKINKGKVANEYNSYSTVSTLLIVIQLGVLFKYLADELMVGKEAGTIKGKLDGALTGRLASVMYLLTIGNAALCGIMTIILEYFSTDG
jgi:hypothetical protein|uniref:Uncharacterized protein n=1 Tax=viral metagenome TaxID=1070528 RepID=A0A6C0JGW1_9ZZZZ